MAKQPVTDGVCQLCQMTFSKQKMKFHVPQCLVEHAAGTKIPSGEKGRAFMLLIEGAGMKEYWAHVLAPATATLCDLDAFLRDLWLECCGHLSQFIINKDFFSSSGPDPFMADFGLKQLSMNVKLAKAWENVETLTHEYDMGSTTTLAIKILSTDAPAIDGKKIKLLSRNIAPMIACSECGAPATFICQECGWEPDTGLYCDACAKEHEHEDMMLPVVNSPRCGVCGYAG